MLSLIINKKMKKLLIPVIVHEYLISILGRSIIAYENILDEPACLKTLPLTILTFLQKLNWY